MNTTSEVTSMCYETLTRPLHPQQLTALNGETEKHSSRRSCSVGMRNNYSKIIKHRNPTKYDFRIQE